MQELLSAAHPTESPAGPNRCSEVSSEPVPSAAIARPPARPLPYHRTSDHPLKLVQSLAVITAVSLPCIGNAAWLYEYTGNQFEDNRIPGSTFISLAFETASPLASGTTYTAPWWTPGTLRISDGASTFAEPNVTAYGSASPEAGPLLRTDQSGSIDLWSIIVLAGANRLLAPNFCCTVNDPPVMYTDNLQGGGSTDGSLQNNNFYGGPRSGYSYNNLMPGDWSVSVTPVPEPAAWQFAIAGLAILAAVRALQNQRRPSHGSDLEPAH